MSTLQYPTAGIPVMQRGVQNAEQWLKLVAYHDLHYAAFIYDAVCCT
jgi:hypothetical protein